MIEENPIIIFHDRLAKIGINVTFIGNYPWVYLDTVNGKKVKGSYMSKGRFTVFFQGVKIGQVPHITDISVVFKKIRETLCQ